MRFNPNPTAERSRRRNPRRRRCCWAKCTGVYLAGLRRKNGPRWIHPGGIRGRRGTIGVTGAAYILVHRYLWGDMPLSEESDPSGSGETVPPRRRWEERTAADSTTGRASHTARPACFLFLPTPSQPRRTRPRSLRPLLDHIAALPGSPCQTSAPPLTEDAAHQMSNRPRPPPPLPISCPDALPAAASRRSPPPCPPLLHRRGPPDEHSPRPRP